ncbi:MAG TPA: DUF302 domain-containing protein [Gammaproteobacteria bacterium]|nr:DUF302 domain-containing protein [Gammaproteobacteria bacterium]
MKNNMMRIFISLVIGLLISTSQAEELMMARTKQSFPEAMLKLQETILDMGYKISRIQRIDIGLTKSGFETDKYRIVFFATAKDVAEISKKYPHLVPYIPWKIAIFAEQQDTLLVSADPMQLSNKKYPGADKYLSKWKKDTRQIMQILRKSE